MAYGRGVALCFYNVLLDRLFCFPIFALLCLLLEISGYGYHIGGNNRVYELGNKTSSTIQVHGIFACASKHPSHAWQKSGQQTKFVTTSSIQTGERKQSPNRRGGKDMMIRVMVSQGNSHQGRNRYSNMEEAKVQKPPACIGGKGR